MLEETLSRLTEHWKVILGPLLVLVVLFAKGGIAGAIEAWRRRKTTLTQMLRKADGLVRTMADESVAHCRRWGVALSRRLDRLMAVAKRATAEALAGWKPLQAALGHRLTTLRQSVERGMALAAARWRRR
jgi:formate-dependent phosphoribosylglycinamide formyltransferase (GAR transformylase)